MSQTVVLALALVCVQHAAPVLGFSFGARALRTTPCAGAFVDKQTLPLRPAFRASVPMRPAPPRLLSPTLRGSVKMSGADLEDDEQQEVVVSDLETGKSVECYVDQRIKLDTGDYVLVYPCDTPVVLAFVDGDGDGEELVPVPESDVGRVFGAAYKACAAQDVELINSAVVLTLQGDLEDDLDQELEDYGEAGEDEEYVKVITSFTESGIEYLVTEPLEPVLIVAKEEPAGGREDGDARERYICLPEEEVAAVMPQVEKLLEQRFELADD